VAGSLSLPPIKPNLGVGLFLRDPLAVIRDSRDGGRTCARPVSMEFFHIADNSALHSAFAFVLETEIARAHSSSSLDIVGHVFHPLGAW
jgi:hypothetical protein